MRLSPVPDLGAPAVSGLAALVSIWVPAVPLSLERFRSARFFARFFLLRKRLRFRLFWLISCVFRVVPYGFREG